MAKMVPSDEATKDQLQLARQQGDVFANALNEMINNEAHGGEKQIGDYLVGYAVEHAEGMYQLQGGELVWYEPRDENAHIEISVRDAVDGRFIPGLRILLTVLDENENEVGTNEQPFIWHPWLYHYGRNWVLPASGRYILHIHIDAPDFMRHDRQNGQRYAEPVEVEFTNVQIELGQKKSS
jgi:hypothetical protein